MGVMVGFDIYRGVRPKYCAWEAVAHMHYISSDVVIVKWKLLGEFAGIPAFRIIQ